MSNVNEVINYNFKTWIHIFTPYIHICIGFFGRFIDVISKLP